MVSKSPFVVAIDQGTAATRAFRLDADGEFQALCAFEHRQFYPQAGWVEHDPGELLRNVGQCLDYATGTAGIGLDNQGETVVAWHAETGEPLYNAIVWQDSRTLPQIERLRADGAEALTLERAGLPLDTVWAASKLRWLLDHAPSARPLARSGKLRLATSDSFLLDRLCGVYATDITTASRTGLMNIRTGRWDPELCRLFGVPIDLLPPIRPSTAGFGTVRPGAGAIVASVADHQAALFGHGCHRPGDTKITFGTGAFALAISGDEPPVPAGAGTLPTVAWQIGEQTTFALDGGVYNAGSALNWVRSLGLYSSQRDLDRFDGPTAIERGLVFVPALSGLACPYWDRTAAGLWIGLRLDTDRTDLVRAALEGVALRSAQVIRTFAARLPLADTISIDGPLARSRYFREFLARATQRTIRVPSSPDLTGLGCAQMAFLGAGLGPVETLPPVAAPDFEAAPDAPLEGSLLARFDDAVSRTRGWYEAPAGEPD